MANLKDTLVFGKLTATGTITANKFKGPLEGNADTATKFSSSKTISLSGDVSGTGSSDGESQWEITTSVADNSHAHTSENISDLSTTLTTWLNSAKSYTDTAVAGVVDSAPDVLNTLKELSAALNNDKDYYVTINNALAGKVAKTGDEMSGALIFSTNDAIKYKNGSTRTGVPIRFYGGDVNGSAVVIGDGGLTLIGGGESASNLRTALVDTNKTKTNASEELYLTSDSTIYLYTNYQTAASAKITTYDASGNWTMPGTITATQFTGPSKALYSSGFGNGTLTYLQTSSDFNGNSGWSHYLIANHGDGEIYYNYTIALPFWGAPKYRRKTGYAGSSPNANRATDAAAQLSDWYDFLTTENYATTLDNVYLQLTGGTMSGGLTVNSNITTSGSLHLNNNGDLAWTSGSWWQRIKITDDSTSGTNVFEFQQRPGENDYVTLFAIKDNGSILSSNAGGGDVALTLLRGQNADWNILSSNGDLRFQCNYTSSKGSYFDILTLKYNDGGIIAHKHITPTTNNSLNLGSSSYKWANVYATTFTGNLNGNASSATIADKVVGSYTYNGGQQNPNYFGTNKVGFLMMNTSVNGNTQYKDWLIMDCYSGSDVGGGVAFGVNRQSLGAYIMRSTSERTSWSETAELALLSTGNTTTNYIPKFTNKNTISNSNIMDDGTNITMSKQVVFANNVWNTMGDDAYFGDRNIAGAFCIKGKNGLTTLRMYGYDDAVTTTANFQYNTSDKCIDVIFS